MQGLMHHAVTECRGNGHPRCLLPCVLRARIDGMYLSADRIPDVVNEIWLRGRWGKSPAAATAKTGGRIRHVTGGSLLRSETGLQFLPAQGKDFGLVHGLLESGALQEFFDVLGLTD